MPAGFPVKQNYAAGDILTATQMNDLSSTLNYLDPTAKGDLFPASSGTALTRLAVGANGETLVADSSTTTGLRWQGDYAAGKNLINNGDMSIAQRGTSTSSVTTSGYYAVDRFANTITSMGTYTISQESDGPAGFGKSFKTLVTTADATPAASSRTVIIQRQEGLALQRLAFGTASAKTTTMSFYVKSNVTGTYILELATVLPRSISASYTINAANTWEKKTITFAGDSNTALAADNGVGIAVVWWLGAGTDFTSGTLATSWAATTTSNRAVGQVNFAAATNNYFQITGVQWEIGSVATDFQLSAGTLQGETYACQYYFKRVQPSTAYAGPFGFGYSNTTTQARIQLNGFSQQMRTSPSVTFSAAGNFVILNAAGNQVVTATSSLSVTPWGTTVTITTGAATQTAGQGVLLGDNGTTSATIDFSAEL